MSLNAYSLALLVLGCGLLGNALASGLALERALRAAGRKSDRWLWAAMGCGALLLGLHHGHALELALKTGLYDLDQTLRSGAASLLMAISVYGLTRRI